MTDTADEVPAQHPEHLPAGTIPPDGTPLGALAHILSLNHDRKDDEPALPGTCGWYEPGTPGTVRYVDEASRHAAQGVVLSFVTWGDLRRIAEDAWGEDTEP